MLQSRVLLLLVTASGPAAWGTTYVVTTQWLPPERPFLVAALRALPIGLAVLAVTRVLPRGRWWARTAVLGTLNIGFFFAMLFVAAYRLPGGVAATLGAVQPLIVAGLSVPVLGARLRAGTVLVGLTGVVGVAMLVLNGAARMDPLGVLAGVAGAASMAAGVVLAKRWGRPEGVGVMTFTGWLLTAGGLVLVPVALLLEGTPPPISPSQGLGLVYMAVVSTGLAYAVWLQGIERLPATHVSFLGLTAPVVATLAGWTVLGEGLTGLQWVGMALALGSLVAGQLTGRARGASPGAGTRHVRCDGVVGSGAGRSGDRRDVELELDLLADEDSTGLQGSVPGQAPVLAVDRRGPLEADAKVAVRVAS
jgi:probable blue pigment (indigoidine) exporter